MGALGWDFRIKAILKLELQASFNRIFEEVDYALCLALNTVGGAQIGQAQRLSDTIKARLGPLLAFAGVLAPLIKALDEAAKGVVKQERYCCAAPAAAAHGHGGATIAASGGASVTISGGEPAHESKRGGKCAGGGAIPYPYCDCGKGEWRIAGKTPEGVATREHPMNTQDQITAARQAIEALKQKWVKEQVIGWLKDSHKALAESAPLSAPAAAKVAAAKLAAQRAGLKS